MVATVVPSGDNATLSNCDRSSARTEASRWAHKHRLLSPAEAVPAEGNNGDRGLPRPSGAGARILNC